MSKLIKLLKIDKEFIFFGQINDLKEKLKNSSDLNYEILTEREIKFNSTMSLGTGGYGIYVRAFADDLDSERLKINLWTEVRREHYFLAVLFVFSLLGIIFSDEPKSILLYVFGLWIICHAWFQFIYRLQENNLVREIVSTLSLTKM